MGASIYRAAARPRRPPMRRSRAGPPQWSSPLAWPVFAQIPGVGPLLRAGGALALLLALARPAAGDEPARIDLRDLPPLPEIVSDRQAADVAVAAAAEVEEDVVVSAAKREQSLGDVASAVTVISGDRLRRFGYRTVAEALRAAAGLFVVNDRMTERLGIRGLQLLGDFNTRILVLVDGATVNEPWNQYAGIALDSPVRLADVDRIEIIRGPVSSLYGANAFFGIINIVTRGADKSPRAWGRVETSSIRQVGATAGFAAGGLHSGVRGNVSMHRRWGEDVPLVLPVEGALTSGADGIESYAASVAGQWQGFFGQVRAFQHARELTGAPYEAVPGDRRNQAMDREVMAEGGYTRDVGERVTLTARTYVNTYWFEDYLVYEPDPNFTDVARSTWAGVELRGLLRVLPRNRLSITAGTELSLADVESDSGDEGAAAADRVQVPTSINTQGVYAEALSTILPWLSVSAGLRFDRAGDESASVKRSDSNLSPRLGLLLAHGARLGAKLLYAEGFRSPSPIEVFFEDGDAYAANPALRPERIRSLEAVLWGRPVRGASVRLSAFRWDLEDLIEQTTNADDLIVFDNIAQLTATGLEAEGTYRNTAGWLGFAGATVARVRRQTAGGPDEEAPNAPLVVAVAGVSTPRLLGVAHVSTQVQVLSDRRSKPRIAGVEGPRADAHVGWDAAVTAPDWRGLELTLGVRNILGTREQVPAQEDYDRYDDVGDVQPTYLLPGEGREVYVRVGGKY